MEEELEHIGIKKRSGRYPWGSGKDPYQRSKAAKAYIDDLKNQGLSRTEIAEAVQTYGRTVGKGDPHFKFNTSDLVALISTSTEEIKRENIGTAVKLKATGMSTKAIGKEMGNINESTVRGWLKAYETNQVSSLRSTANALKDQVDLKGFLDVGAGEHLYMGVAYSKFKNSLAMLRDEGYVVHPIRVPQLGTGGNKMTNVNVLCKPGTSWHQAKDAVLNGKLRVITTQMDDDGINPRTAKDMPRMASSKQIQVRFKEQGGHTMDGVIELRRGVAELDLGASRYGQVRIGVDGTHFLKGMAMYADDLPDGINIRFNTNKKESEVSSKLDAMKPLKRLKVNGVETDIDTDFPFGSTTYPRTYVDGAGRTKQSLLNIVGSSEKTGNIEGRWDQWADTLSSQFASKQSVKLAATQLNKAREAKQKDLDEIMALTNPVVKRKLLDEFAESADAAAVHLKAAAMPNQSTHVILPMNNMRRHEVYAPNFDNGEKVVLVRHPHGGPFEIPELTVNNNSRTAKRILGNAKDAIGIHHSVAEQLSGADFDGDTVLVIPNSTGKVKTRPPLEGLKNFDAKAQYKIPDDDTTTTRMTKKNTQTEMGKISNLITDMTIKGAQDHEIARAVRHSMVVIDAEKHGLDYKRSAEENNIAQLKKAYQVPPDAPASKSRGGASTIISRSSSTQRIPAVELRKGSPKDGLGPIDTKTGELVYVRKIDRKTGEPVEGLTKGTQMQWIKDARELSSGTPMEDTYADYANSMKAMANQARLSSLKITNPKQNPRARSLYDAEVKSLEQKLKIAERNSPLERRAQVLGNWIKRTRVDSDPTLDKDAIKKITYQSLEEGRAITGANKLKIEINDREWEAIQSGAVSASKLRSILNNADMKQVKQLATPRYRSSLTPGQIARAKAMQSSGKGAAEIAEALGIPRSTIVDNLANA